MLMFKPCCSRSKDSQVICFQFIKLLLYVPDVSAGGVKRCCRRFNDSQICTGMGGRHGMKYTKLLSNLLQKFQSEVLCKTMPCCIGNIYLLLFFQEREGEI